MFCVVYEFTVDTHQEKKFQELWHQLTLEIKTDIGALGSRLHKVLEVENTWVAYGQWISEQAYEKAPNDKHFNQIREKFLETCRGIKILYQMQMTDDLFSV